MPTYALCQINTKLSALKKGQDAEVLKVLKEQTKIAIENTKLYKEEIERLKASGKTTIAEMEKRLDVQKNRALPDPTDVTTVKAGVDIIQASVTFAAKEGEKLMAALAEYRGGWDGTAKGLLADPKQVDLFMELRKKQINEFKLIKAEEARLAEYLKRAALVAKASQDASNQGGKALDALRSEVKQLAKEIKEHADQIDNDLYKDNNKFKTFDTGFKGKVLTSKQMTDAEGLGKHLEAGRKNLKGSVKTLEAEVTRLVALTKPKAFIFQGEVADAAKLLKKAKDDVAKFESNVKDVAAEIVNLKKKVK